MKSINKKLKNESKTSIVYSQIYTCILEKEKKQQQQPPHNFNNICSNQSSGMEREDGEEKTTLNTCIHQ